MCCFVLDVFHLLGGDVNFLTEKILFDEDTVRGVGVGCEVESVAGVCDTLQLIYLTTREPISGLTIRYFPPRLPTGRDISLSHTRKTHRFCD